MRVKTRTYEMMLARRMAIDLWPSCTRRSVFDTDRYFLCAYYTFMRPPRVWRRVFHALEPSIKTYTT